MTPSSSSFSRGMGMFPVVGPYFLLPSRTLRQRAMGGRSRGRQQRQRRQRQQRQQLRKRKRRRGWWIRLVCRRRILPRTIHEERHTRPIPLLPIRGGRPGSWEGQTRPPAFLSPRSTSKETRVRDYDKDNDEEDEDDVGRRTHLDFPSRADNLELEEVVMARGRRTQGTDARGVGVNGLVRWVWCVRKRREGGGKLTQSLDWFVTEEILREIETNIDNFYIHVGAMLVLPVRIEMCKIIFVIYHR